MTQTLLFLIGATILLVVVSVLGRGTIVRVYGAVTGQTRRKNKSKEKALIFLENKDATNGELAKHLSVSARTVVNYMDELEEEGRVEQVGETGRSVIYRLKT